MKKSKLTWYNGLLIASVLASSQLYAFGLDKKVQRETREPEAATGFEYKKVVTGNKYMVAAANPYASEAGFNILSKGGNVIDAAIAVQLVLTLVEPQSSGIGGGAFMLYWDESKQNLETYDGRETAPAGATSDMFIGKNGKPVRWIEAVVGGRSVGVPGVLHALKKAHEKHGKLPWSALFDDAIKLAEHGFIVSPRLEKLVSLKFNPGMVKLPKIKNYFYPNDEAVKAGQLLKNPELAVVFKSLAKDGIKPFYQGWIAQDIVKAVQHAKIAPGVLTLEDMKNYRSVERAPVCGPYYQYKVCGMAPPSSGGVAVIQILGQLSQLPDYAFKPSALASIHAFTQSSRLAFADRNRYIADADFVDVPVQGLIAPDYMHARAALISKEKDMGLAHPGQPQPLLAYADDNAIERPSTSHISIIDGDNNAISMTTSVEMGFGSAVMVNGFILNNQLTDFSLSPKKGDKLVANRVEANKRPRSSMAPMMAFNQDGSLRLVVGSPGGSRIINYVAQTMQAILKGQLNPQQAINLPRYTNRNKVTTLEKGTAIEKLKPALERMGHKVMIRDLNSGIQAIEIKQGQLLGGADPRREGRVLAK